MRFNCICMEWTDRYSICKPLVRVCGDTTFHVVAHETVDFNRFHLARAPTQRSTETHRALLHRLQESIGCIKWKDRTRTEWQASKHVNFPTYRAGHEKCTRGIGTAPATQNHHQTCWCLSKHGPRSPHFALATEHCNLQHFSVRSPHVKSLVMCTMFSACHASAGKTSANALSRHFMYFCLALRPFESKWNTSPTVLEARGETAVTSQHAILMCLLKDIHWMRAAASITSWKITFGKFLWSVFSSHCTPFGFTSWFAWETVLPCVHWCPSYLFWKKNRRRQNLKQGLTPRQFQRAKHQHATANVQRVLAPPCCMISKTIRLAFWFPCVSFRALFPIFLYTLIQKVGCHGNDSYANWET